MVLGDYSPEIVCLLFALMRAGSIVVPVTREAIVDLDTVLELSEAQWIIDFSGDEPSFTRTGRTSSNHLVAGLRARGIRA